MFGFGPKRSRISRSVARRAPETFACKIRSLTKDRDLMARLGLTLGALILLTIVLQSWKAPFPFREGDIPSHGIAAKRSFDRIDPVETRRARERAEQQVPLTFRNDPSVLEPLPQELKSALGEIAQAMQISELSPATQRDFGLVPLEAVNEPRLQLAQQRFGAEDPEDRFRKLQAAVLGPDMSMAQERIVEMVDDFTKFISPLRQLGVIDINDIRRQRITPGEGRGPGIDADRYLLITPESDHHAEGQRVLVSQVRLEQQLNEAGALGKAWLSYPSLKPEIRPALSHWLMVHVQPTLRYDQLATKAAIAAARSSVPDIPEAYIAGDLLVRPGERIDSEKLQLLVDEYVAAEQEISWTSRSLRMLIVFLMVLVLAGLNGFYIVANEPRLFREFNHIAVFLAVIVLTAFFARLLSFDPLRAEMIPILATVLLLSIAYNRVLAAITAFSLCLIFTLSTSGRFDQFIVLLSTCSLAIIPLDRVASRTTLVKVSFVSAITYFVINLGIVVIQSQSLSEVLANSSLLAVSAKGALLCLIAGYLVAGTLPLIESTFGVVTDMSLLELSDPSHPLLQELVRLAPGTYNHSVAVASIAETAAERIGGNDLLVRVGAYFHDIGKMLKPNYFVENLQAGAESPHNSLNPAMSTLIIIGHVKDGIELAEQYKLPQAIINFIEQHHGTTLVEYFYREATKIVECQPDHRTDAEESSFRYPGPKPQTKEAGVLMIVDACESACRTLTEPTPKRIESLVKSIIMRRLTDGQFDECELKMNELHTIEESVIKSLIGIYHGRIRYPDAKEPKEPRDSDAPRLERPSSAGQPGRSEEAKTA
ncbi:MAG: HDIG domain-containing protein [Planctomycetaceae bacterium]|nr:HDIG domain-containing protein [Planctomycetaceae bacterium]